jgi:hypothetical protein
LTTVHIRHIHCPYPVFKDDISSIQQPWEVKAPMPPELFRQRIFSSEGLKFTWRSDLMQAFQSIRR